MTEDGWGTSMIRLFSAISSVIDNSLQSSSAPNLCSRGATRAPLRLDYRTLRPAAEGGNWVPRPQFRHSGPHFQVWEHTLEQRVAASTLRRYSFGLRLAIAQAKVEPFFPRVRALFPYSRGPDFTKFYKEAIILVRNECFTSSNHVLRACFLF